ncbi:hypothetical protein DSM03_103351 [Leeuwenhoekiella aestuarii]|uniref:Histidyl-tRNA synthetase n=1 Tax=Leeuwenhoekiella aestuarii TaxID=2249426 RepID=A0A4Q0NY43_9FLAO|nr:DUF6495 family protein [Leeuwenhoekiella aestuarii]RXG16165.1 hypothetical protein DSM03_103351 [Leeuwenhoekiella aestuarii]RXG16858.1 hypothetical protein DSM04_102440 [Leeuwenhoekiella aestuarii]
MKYIRLSKEQLDEMHQEFINFLAAQSITADEWDDIKKNKPEVAEQELDVFSDLVWEGVLGKVEYLEHFSQQHMFLFKVGDLKISMISIEVENKGIDITTAQGYKWLQENFMKDEVNLYSSSKLISDDRNNDIFVLIRQGANITQGDLYKWFEKFVEVD